MAEEPEILIEGLAKIKHIFAKAPIIEVVSTVILALWAIPLGLLYLPITQTGVPTPVPNINDCKIVYSLGYTSLYIIDGDGENQHPLTDEAGGYPVWSPDGRYVAFVSPKESHGLYVVESDGSNLRQLAENLFPYEFPAWSPDGTQIAFITNTTVDSLKQTRLYVVDIDGGEPRRLGPLNGYYGYPSWSPDGTRIAFDVTDPRNAQHAKSLPRSLMFAQSEVQSNIYLIASDGSLLQPLVHDGFYPRWSPDGEHIVFVSRRNTQADIFLVDLSGENERNLTESAGDDYLPQWSPDGEHIVFVSNRDGNKEIYIMDSSGGNQRNLTNREAEDDWPNWSPDGKYLVFTSDSTNPIFDDLWVLDLDNAYLYPITHETNHERPTWSPMCSSVNSINDRNSN